MLEENYDFFKLMSLHETYVVSVNCTENTDLKHAQMERDIIILQNLDYNYWFTIQINIFMKPFIYSRLLLKSIIPILLLI